MSNIDKQDPRSVEVLELAPNLMLLTAVVKDSALQTPDKEYTLGLSKDFVVGYKVEKLGKKSKDYENIDLKEGDIISIGVDKLKSLGSDLILTDGGIKFVTRISNYIAKIKINEDAKVRELRPTKL